MATLEKIRSKSVLLIVVIGLALLAFIVGDLLTNSRNLFGSGTTVAEIDGVKIDITEYQQKREELNDRYEQARKQNPQAVAGFDQQQLPQMAIDQLVLEHLIDRAVESLGIRVTGDQLRFYMIDNPINQKMGELLQAMQQSGISVQTPEQAFEIIFNPKRNGLTDADVAGFQKYWLQIENETKQLVARNTYQRLLSSTFKANELDKKALYNDYVQTSQLQVAFTPYGNLDPKKYAVSDAEIKAQYEKDKQLFKVEEETKSVSFIAVNISPSAADRKNSKSLADQVVKELSDSASDLSKNTKKTGVSVSRREVRAADINGPIKEFVTAATNGQVKLINESMQGFTVVRMGKTESMVDSIQLNIVQVAGSKLPAQVLAALNGGLAVDSLSTKFKADSVQAQKEQWIPLFAAGGKTGALEDGQLDTLLNAGGKYINLLSTPQGSVLAKVVKQTAAKQIYEFDEVTYELKPSTETVNAARTQLEKFLAQNNSAATFSANAAKAGYTVQNADLTQSSAAVPSPMGLYPDSRQVVRWVLMDGSVGEVSHIYESKDALHPMLYAVAINSETEDFIPVDNKNVKDFLTEKVRRAKAGDEMVKKFSAAGTTIEQIAAAMKVEPFEVADFRFGRSGSVRDASVIGKIAGSKPGAKVLVLKGDDGVYAVKVNGNKKESFKYEDNTYARQYQQALSPDYNKMMRSGKTFNNNVYKFEAGD